MSNVEFFVLSAALGMDLFSVAIPIGMQRIRLKTVVKASAVFAVFHILMLLSGCYLGRFLGSIIDRLGAQSGISLLMMEDWARIMGALVLALLGFRMLMESFRDKALNRDIKKQPLGGIALLLLAFSVSIDALAVGFGFGMFDVNLVQLNLILGCVIFTISVIGLNIGRQAGKFLGERAEQIGAVALLLLSAHILWNLLA